VRSRGAFLARGNSRRSPLAYEAAFGTLASVLAHFELGLMTMLGLCCVATQVAAQTGAATAVPESPEVRVDCPELSAEQRAAIEARHVSELVSQGGARGMLLLVCSGDRVSGTWQEDAVVLDSRSLSRNEGEDAVELLHWVASVLLEMRHERETSAGMVQPSAAAAIPVMTSEPAETAPPVPQAQAAKPADTPPTRPADSAPSATGSQGSTRKPWTLGLAAAYAHFGTEIAGALGPRLTVDHVLVKRFHLTAAVDLKAGLGSGAGFSMLDVAVAVGATYEIVPFLSVTAGPLLVVTTFQAPAGATGSSSAVVSGGFVVSARARLPLESLRPFVDLGILAATPTRQVTLADEPVLTVPMAQALVAVGVELPL
jgi:hypothetical protein